MNGLLNLSVGGLDGPPTEDNGKVLVGLTNTTRKVVTFPPICALSNPLLASSVPIFMFP